jgi:hypothetical protein
MEIPKPGHSFPTVELMLLLSIRHYNIFYINTFMKKKLGDRISFQ